MCVLGERTDCLRFTLKCVWQRGPEGPVVCVADMTKLKWWDVDSRTVVTGAQAFTANSFPFCNLFEIFHLESLEKVWDGGMGWRSQNAPPMGKRSWVISPRQWWGRDNRAGRALPPFSQWKKTHWSGCVLLLPEGPVQGVLLLSAGQAARTSPRTPLLYCLL